MKFKKILLIVIPVVFIILLAVFVIFKFNKSNSNNDSIRFKNEYESLNNKENEFGKKYKNVKIDKNNPIKYIDYDKLYDVLDSDGIIYLGYSKCQECRIAVEVLLDAALNNHVNTIYYLDIENERDSYTVENNKPVLAKDSNGNEIKGTENYFKLLDRLDEYLTDYVLMVEDKKYEIGEKRIFTPTIIFVKNGKILGVEVSIVGSSIEGNQSLSDEEYKTLFTTYEDYILDIFGSACQSNTLC